jgi:hypothetical protein
MRFFLLLLPLAACDGLIATSFERPVTATQLHHDVATEPAVGAAATGRLTIDQVSASFDTVLGQHWIVTTPGGDRVAIAELASSMGAADYYQRVSEDLEPNLLFNKLLLEGALTACADAVDADATVAAADRHIMRRVEATDTLATSRTRIVDNLRDMKLRFHGQRMDPTGETGLERYLTLFQATSTADGTTPADGWRAVCVALVTEPEFSLF